MKKIIYFLFLFVITLSLISASCPKAGYQYCYSGSGNSGEAHARADVFWSFEDNRGILIPNNLAVKNLYYNFGTSHSDDDCDSSSSWTSSNHRYQVLNAPSWGSCSSSGCSGNGYSSGTTGKVLLATTGQTYTSCLGFDYQYKMTCDSSGNSAWAHAATGFLGSGNCVSIRVVDCVSSSDCTGGLVCNNNACVSACTPATCSSLGKTCGSWSDGCQGNLNCGPLTSGNNVCNSSGQYQQVATAYYQVNVLNNGNVPYTNIKLTSTNPSALFSYFPTNIFSLNSGQNANWTSTSIDISSYHGQTLTAYVQANNTYTSQINNFQASILIP